ncbi:hypothetical protein G6F51_014608 [Rhizopus arrhizus]|uniref:Uncharacterized protein n=1 Tax=Rhizopus oryzae TaxID=64495 RepID=A0A9P6XL93_RHIOR|nr:hypothetical protein G6F51_014608 [Rhizopus arrhizus]
MERLASKVRWSGIPSDSEPSVGATICGGAGAAMASTPCWEKAAIARGMCSADVTSNTLPIPRDFNVSSVRAALS